MKLDELALVRHAAVRLDVECKHQLAFGIVDIQDLFVEAQRDAVGSSNLPVEQHNFSLGCQVVHVARFLGRCVRCRPQRRIREVNTAFAVSYQIVRRAKRLAVELSGEWHYVTIGCNSDDAAALAFSPSALRGQEPTVC